MRVLVHFRDRGYGFIRLDRGWEVNLTHARIPPGPGEIPRPALPEVPPVPDLPQRWPEPLPAPPPEELPPLPPEPGPTPEERRSR